MPKKKVGESPSIKVRLPAGLLAAVDKTADALGCERSEAIRFLIYGGLHLSAHEASTMGDLLRPAWAIARKGAE